ncbi:Epoxide hydrolase 4 [Tetrabaena socialis]|uniref:Epoxide hydrolase 4 n=1 Tax=Tetrabaena socialis TaxID=47790 RepID=A0A2J7ZVT9_9CHLO|nr:Epoxide hydrolase 4 [Tetrabaena socialis]|eukprot:PNH04358.1 Epoxide hydrolase 4 [Tetrabaena socialis]
MYVYRHPVSPPQAVPATSPPLASLRYLVFTPLLWGALLFILLREFIKSRKPRGGRLQDLPLPDDLQGLVHEELDVGGGVRLHAASFGRQPGKPLLLCLHGFPECWYSWRRQLVAFREQYEVVALDMRGFGWSSKPQGISSYTLEKLTADVAGAVHALGRRSCTLLAHDWGGAVAWAAAGRYPGLVDRLMVLAGPHWLLYKANLTAEQMVRSSYFLMFQMPIFAELLLTHTDGALMDAIWRSGGPSSPIRRGAASAADVEVYKAAMLQPGAPTATLNYYRALLMADAGLLPFDKEVERGLRRRLDDLPVLVVWGAEDHALCLSNMRNVQEVAPESEVHVLQHCSHWIQADQPEELQRILDDWLAAHPLSPPATAAAAAPPAGRPGAARPLPPPTTAAGPPAGPPSAARPEPLHAAAGPHAGQLELARPPPPPAAAARPEAPPLPQPPAAAGPREAVDT